MRLNANGLSDRKQWEEKGYALPEFDREKVTAATKENPFWIHFGAGNIFRAFQDMIRSLKGRIHFAHVRNLKFITPTNFEEAAHLSSDGTFDMYEIMKALYDIGFDGPIRPDHGRMIWDEVAMPGYGLYDRALGATYLNGLWEAIDKSQTRK